MDEIAIIGYLDTPKDKKAAYGLINDFLAGFKLTEHAARYDYEINNAKVLIRKGNRNNPNLLPLILQCLERALTLLEK